MRSCCCYRTSRNFRRGEGEKLKKLPVRYRGVTTGNPLLSVTQVLTVANLIDDRWFSPEAARRGSIVHAMTEQIDLHGTCPSVPIDLQGYVNAYLLFLNVARPEILEVELELQDEVIGIGGRLDRIVRLFGRLGVLDLKTGGKYDWHPLQLAAYAKMFGVPNLARWCLYLSDNGRYKLREYDDAADERRFEHHAIKAVSSVTERDDFFLRAA